MDGSQNLQERLLALQDKEYADFHSRLIPGIPRETIIGVRVPKARGLAAEYKNSAEGAAFLRELPHRYYDENMLHGLLLSSMKDYEACLEAVEEFLPYVDNWAVCDCMSPKVFKMHRDSLLVRIREWVLSEKVYTCRFGIGMLMTHYLDEDFRPEYLEIPAAVRSAEYYVNMMIAWFFATALAKQWEAALPYLEQNRLNLWVHNKTIQKARESSRITQEQKQYLHTLRR